VERPHRRPKASPRSAGLTAGLRSVLAAWALPIVGLIGLATAIGATGTRTTVALVAWWRGLRR
jgi:hypothetical protein